MLERQGKTFHAKVKWGKPAQVAEGFGTFKELTSWWNDRTNNSLELPGSMSDLGANPIPRKVHHRDVLWNFWYFTCASSNLKAGKMQPVTLADQSVLLDRTSEAEVSPCQCKNPAIL
jgi:hypothetical protein